jgi:transcriptional regulator with XRE-family HTH domain
MIEHSNEYVNSEDAKMGIDKRLRQVLDERKLSIKEVAESCEIPYRTLQNYLLGEREPNARALTTIGTRLGISIDWLLTGSDPGTRGAAPNTEPAASPAAEISPRERALLTLFKELSDDDQREICRDAEEKKRLRGLERQLKEMQTSLDALKKSG